ncbi:MAG: sigma-70 family RNA polymerase sigma factor, partial [Myxococcales bacterium]|nr:sigma-70 family RNA polymerase sigma factor [Myxococcales bacterium]
MARGAHRAAPGVGRGGAPLIFWLASLFIARVYGAPADELLIRKALNGHGGALRALTQRVLPVVRSRAAAYLRRRGGRLGAQDVDDLTQEIWLSLLEQDGRLLRAYDHSRGKSLEGYVGMVCRRELWRRNRAHLAERRGGGVDAAPIEDAQHEAAATPDPEQATIGRDLLEGLSAFLMAELPERGQLVLKLIYEDHLGPADAAELMGVNTQVVYNWQHKIR